ncbi:1697_t:CDS:2, partial [Ambispora gerdemannii]
QMGIIIETFHGKVPNTKAAAIIFEACRRGILDRTNRRLLDEERRALKGGEIFVFAEKSSGIKRWTDGKYWSPSRVIGDFLVYFELDTRMHNIKREQDINPSLRSRIEREGLKVQIGNKGTFIYRKNGLIKKTVSMNGENDVEHMIIYEYPPSDNSTEEEREKLYPPQAYVELADIEPSEEILKRFQKPNHSNDRERIVEDHGSDDYDNENGSGSSENDKSDECQQWSNVLKSENDGDYNKESNWVVSRESSKVLAYSPHSPIHYSTPGIVPNSPYPHSQYHCSSVHQHACGGSQMSFHNYNNPNNLSAKSPSLHIINPIFLSRPENNPTISNTVVSNKFGEQIPRNHGNLLPAISGRHHPYHNHNLTPITNTTNFHQIENAPIEPSLTYPRYPSDDVRDNLRLMSPVATATSSNNLFSNSSSLRNWPTTNNSDSRNFFQNNHNSTANGIENGDGAAVTLANPSRSADSPEGSEKSEENVYSSATITANESSSSQSDDSPKNDAFVAIKSTKKRGVIANSPRLENLLEDSTDEDINKTATTRFNQSPSVVISTSRVNHLKDSKKSKGNRNTGAANYPTQRAVVRPRTSSRSEIVRSTSSTTAANNYGFVPRRPFVVAIGGNSPARSSLGPVLVRSNSSADSGS